jgi:sugar/nucleoside kinase (ribokinase family)
MIGVVGPLARDVVDGGAPRIGGAAYYCARALATLGRPGVVATKYSAGDRRLAAPLHGLGVPVAWRPSRETVAFRLANRGDEREHAIDALGEPFTVEDAAGWISEALAGASWLHAGALSRADFPVATLAALARERRLSLDGQALVRPGRTGIVHPDADFDPRVLEHVSALKLSEAEAKLVDLDSLSVPELLVTMGSRGVLIRAEGREQHVPTRPLELPDPTGAGDAFAVSYLTARDSGQEPLAAARSATTVVRGLLSGWRS